MKNIYIDSVILTKIDLKEEYKNIPIDEISITHFKTFDYFKKELVVFSYATYRKILISRHF